MRGKVFCYECSAIGTLEMYRKGYFRANHDKMKNGVKTPKRCYFGSLSKTLKKFKKISKIRDDVIDPSFLVELEQAGLKDDVEYRISKEIENSGLSNLIARVLELSKMLGDGWSDKTHYLVKQDNCPHCRKQIQYRFRRIGPYNSTKKNIDSFSIEKGSNLRTSWMDET